MSRIKVEIGGRHYGKGSFGREWSAIVNSYEVGTRLNKSHHLFMSEVCSKIERFAKVMARGRVEFKVVNKVFNGRRVKGVVMISPNSGHEVWLGKAYVTGALFPRAFRPDPAKENKKMAIQALRAIIDPQIKEFRRANLERLRGGLYHIDHVYPFKLLVQEWCRDNALDLETIPIKCTGATCRLESVDMAESWFDYHLLNSNLQILEAGENLRKGSRYFGPADDQA